MVSENWWMDIRGTFQRHQDQPSSDHFLLAPVSLLQAKVGGNMNWWLVGVLSGLACIIAAIILVREKWLRRPPAITEVKKPARHRKSRKKH